MRGGERVLILLERVLEGCASLKLAIFTISGLAFFLATATVYESFYGGPAVQAMVYASPAFFTVMVLLAINVAAAVIVRYPWKRRQTGFIITHIGIETLLLGCLISYRQSSEGVVALRAGQTVDAIDSINEGVFVSWNDGDHVRQEALPLECWSEAGYPTVGRFVGGLVKALPDEPAWVGGTAASKNLAPNVKLDIVQWLPAAKFERNAVPDPKGTPAVQIRLAGQTPNGMAQDERVWLHQDESLGATASVFGGMIEAVLWQARGPADVDAFTHPPAAEQLPASGVVSVGVAGKWQRLDVAADLNKTIAIADTGWHATLLEYFPEARWDGSKLTRQSDTPNDPMVRLRLDAPGGSAEWVASARYPFLTGVLKDGLPPKVEQPTVVFDHPAVFVTQRDGQRGRLQLLQTTDGKLYQRRFGLKGLMEMPAEIAVGQDYAGWMGLKLSVLQNQPTALLKDEFLPAKIAPGKMADAMRAAKVVLTVDGTPHELWLARGAGPTQVATSRGPMTVAYGFDALRLPFQLSLDSARMTRDPGANSAAAYESDVQVVGDDGKKSAHQITMNEPLSVGGFTFYQSGFDDTAPNGPITILRMRRDQGRLLKYAGCGLIVGGIFLMFYMKAYFQTKLPAPKPAAKPARPLAASAA